VIFTIHGWYLYHGLLASALISLPMRDARTGNAKTSSGTTVARPMRQ
jgi:hypothetical protein